MIKKLWFVFFLIGFLGTNGIQAQDEFGDDEFGFGMPAAEEPELPIETTWELDYTRRGFIEVLYVSDDSFKYGEYNGHSEKGLYLTGELDVIKRPGQDSPFDNGFWTFRADDIGLKTRSFELVTGKQGFYTISLDFRNHFSVRNDTGASPFDGNTVLTLPNTWVASNNTSGMSLANLSSVDQEVERNQVGLEFTREFPGPLAMSIHYEFEHKSGDLVRGASIYIDAANPHSVLVPVPVDYDNHEVGLTLDYTTSALQMQLSVLTSELNHDESQLLWQNPYASATLVSSGSFAAGVDYPDGFGGLDLPADKRFQQVRFNGNYTFSPLIRLRVDASQGRSELTEDLSPYTVNSSLSVTEPLPVMDIDDALDTRHLYVSVLTKPIRRTTISFKYKYEQRENTLPVLPWQYVRGDGADQPPPIKAVFNQPHEIEKDQYTVEGTMRFRAGGSRLTLGYDYNEVGRTFSAVDDTEEDVYRAEFRFRTADKLITRIDYQYSDLVGSTYDWNQAFFNTFTVEQINQIPDNQRFTNHPLLRQFHLADHEETKGGLNFNYLVNSDWNVMLALDYSDTDYDETELGLRSATNQMVNLSVNYTPSETLTSYFWISSAANEVEQRGRAFRGGIEKPANDIFPPLAEGSDPSRNWDVTQKGDNQSVGAGFEWTIIENKLEIGGDYTFVSTVIEDTIDVFGALDLTGEDLPDIESDMHHLEITGDYHVSPELSLRLHYAYYRFESEDWALDGVQVDTLDKVLTLGQTNPDETVNVISLTFLYRF